MSGKQKIPSAKNQTTVRIFKSPQVVWNECQAFLARFVVHICSSIFENFTNFLKFLPLIIDHYTLIDGRLLQVSSSENSRFSTSTLVGFYIFRFILITRSMHNSNLSSPALTEYWKKCATTSQSWIRNEEWSPWSERAKVPYF